MTRSRRLGTLASLALAACAAEIEGSAPRVTSVAPPSGYVSRETAITIRGDGFRVRPYQTAAGAPAVDATFRAWLGETELHDVEWASEGELRARVPRGLPSGIHALELRDPYGRSALLEGAFAVAGGAPPALAVTATVLPSVASLGQPVTVRVDVENAGDLPARAVVARAVSLGGAIALPSGASEPSDVPGGATRTFFLEATAAALGTAELRARATGTDEITGAVVDGGEVSAGSVCVQPPSFLTASAAAPARASVGQELDLEVTYSNASGAATVSGLAPSVVAVGLGAVETLQGATPCDVAGGRTCVATFRLRAASPGEVELQVNASGVDANSGEQVAAPRVDVPLAVDRGALLSGVATASPSRASVLQPLTIALAVTNEGDVTARGVVPSLLAAPTAGEPGAAPPARDIPAGETWTFERTFVPLQPGEGAFLVTAVGEDANGAGAVTTGVVQTNAVAVQAPPLLVATAEVEPAAAPGEPVTVSAGQAVTVTLRVTNLGEADADAPVAALGFAATGSASLTAAPRAGEPISPGETATFVLEAVASGSGSLALAPRVDALDANSGAPVEAIAAPVTVRVQAPAALAVAIEAPALVNALQPFTAVVVVANGGEAGAVGVVPTLVATGVASCAAAPVPAPPAGIAGGERARFEWSCAGGEGTGLVALEAGAAGADANAGTPIAAPPAQAAVAVQRPAALAVELLSAPARVNRGQSFPVRLRIRNDGDAAALDVSGAIGCDGCALASPPSPADVVPGGGWVDVEATLTAGPAGASTLRAGATGTDATDGGERAAAQVTRPLSVEHPAALAAAFHAPAAAPLAGFVVELEATNPPADPPLPQADALAVAPGALAVVEGEGLLAASEVSCAPAQVAAADVVAGGAAWFRWTCSAARVGSVRFAAGVSGLDGNDGAPLAAAAAATWVLDEAIEVVADPFADGTAFSFVFGYDGHVFLGPSGDGRGVVRCAPDGGACASFAFAFAYDTTEWVSSVQTGISRNVPPIGCATPVTTLGAVGWCNPDNPQSTACYCGPDLESGRGTFTSVRLGPAQDEWLVAMGRTKKMGELNYAYMTRSTSSPLSFSYVDLYVAMPPSANVENVVSTAVLDGRVHFGLQVEAMDSPRLVVLARTPAPPGLDAVSSADAYAITFDGTALQEKQTSVTQVDAVAGFEGRLFVANRKAVLVSRTGAPTGAADFDECTPLAPADWEASGIQQYPTKVDVTPADKGVTALTAWAGRLYLARNTRAGVPELWAFTPRRDGQGALLGCAADRSDWRRIATQLGASTSTHATALFASDEHLYYGLDDGTVGVRLFRTASPAPAGDADFRGRLGCAAPCEPLGRAGFGDATVTRFFDARALAFGGEDQVWATAGNGTGAVRVFRIAE